MPYTALRNLRVVDLTSLIAGPFATKLLADAGAEVIKIEPPGGEVNGAIDRDRAGAPLFAFLNANKLGVTANLGHDRGRDFVLKLLEGADLLIESLGPARLERSGLNPQGLLRRFPRL